MASNITKSNIEKVTLERPADWIKWERELSTVARSKKVWEIIVGEKQPMEEPEFPDLEELFEGDDEDNDHGGRRGGRAAARDDPLKRAAFRLQYYNQKHARYTKQDTSLDAVKDWVKETVANHYRTVS